MPAKVLARIAMEIQNTTNLMGGIGPGASPVAGNTGSGGSANSFSSILSGVQGSVEDAKKARAKKTEDVAGSLVAYALILPMLKQIRQSPWNKSGPFAPGNGEKAFGTQFDIEIAERIARSPRMSLTESVRQRLSAKEDRVNQSEGLDVHG
jgi:hypothetical protein